MTTRVPQKLPPTRVSLCLAALLVATVPGILNPGSTNVAALFLNPNSGEGSSTESSLNSLDVFSMTKTDILPLVCATLSRGIFDCQHVPEWSDYYGQNWERLTNQIGGRKRRFASSWNGGPTWAAWNNDPWLQSTWASWNPTGGHPIPSPGGKPAPAPPTTVTCRTQVNQSAIYQLSSNFTMFPAEAISDELGRNLQLLDFLRREIVFKKTSPLVLQDEFLKNANASCPSTELRLWKYFSVKQAQTCWVLANFGDFVDYRRCNKTRCGEKCPMTNPPPTQPWTANQPSVYGSSSVFSNSFWAGWHQPTTTTTTTAAPTTAPTQPDSSLNRKLCITDYRATSFWAYCPKLAAGKRIIRDRIILPLSCSCQTVRCEADRRRR